MGNVREGAGDEVAEPGSPVVLHAETINREITVVLGRSARGEGPALAPGDVHLQPRRQGRHLPGHAGSRSGRLPFAVNLFDFRESDLAPRGLVPEGAPTSTAESYKIKIGYNPVTGTQKPAKVQKDIWWYFALLVLGVCSSSGMSIIGGSIFKSYSKIFVGCSVSTDPVCEGSRTEPRRSQELIRPGRQLVIEGRPRLLAIVDPQVIARAVIDAIEGSLEVDKDG